MLGLCSWWPHLQKKHSLPSSGSWKPNSTILTHAKLVGKVLQKTLEQILEQDFIVIHMFLHSFIAFLYPVLSEPIQNEAVHIWTRRKLVAGLEKSIHIHYFRKRDHTQQALIGFLQLWTIYPATHERVKMNPVVPRVLLWYSFTIF